MHRLRISRSSAATTSARSASTPNCSAGQPMADPSMGGYGLMDTGNGDDAVGGGIGASAAPDDGPGVRIYMRVDDLDAYLEPRRRSWAARRWCRRWTCPADTAGSPCSRTRMGTKWVCGADRRNAWKALAEPRRREILRLVAHDELAAGEIAAAFDVSRTAVSQHLTVLRNAEPGRRAPGRHPAALPGPAGGPGRTAPIPRRHVGVVPRRRPAGWPRATIITWRYAVPAEPTAPSHRRTGRRSGRPRLVRSGRRAHLRGRSSATIGRWWPLRPLSAGHGPRPSTWCSSSGPAAGSTRSGTTAPRSTGARWCVWEPPRR